MRFGAVFLSGWFWLSTAGAAPFDLGPDLPPGMADLDTGHGFLALTRSPAVRFERGAEAMALMVAQVLPTAIARVEAAHGRPFLALPAIHVLATERSFLRLSPTARAVTRRSDVYLSPRLFERPNQVTGILTHELVHAHFAQHAGTSAAAATVPGWFHEGFAVHVARGAGAERVSAAEAAGAIRAGQHLLPGEGSGIGEAVGRRLGSAMFYRQASLFVDYLERQRPLLLRRLTAALLDGRPFDEAFDRHYGGTPAEHWRHFVAEVTRRE